MTPHEIAGLICFASLPLCALAAWGFYWLCKRLEKAGFLAGREASGSTGGGLIFELDKLTRPSIEHVVAARDKEVESDEHGGK